MYARSTTIRGKVSSIDDGVAHVRDVVMPAIQVVDGFVGLSMIVDRESGRCIITSAWRSVETMRASEDSVKARRDGAAHVLHGTSLVEEWEIAVMHRAHLSREGACVRSTWFQIDPNQVEPAIDVYRFTSLPAIDELEGFCSASLLVDREAGRAVSSVTYDSRGAMERNRTMAGAVRASGSEEAGARVLDVCEFELAIAHLRAPDLA
jgi:heme-degrading monooxygenase HmoA